MQVMEQDKVRLFLVTKLEELRGQNQSVESALIVKRQETLPTATAPEDVKVLNIWTQVVVNYKIVVIYEVVSSVKLREAQIILDSEHSLNYIVHNFEKCFLSTKAIFSDVFENRTVMSVCIDLSTILLQSADFTISGYLYYSKTSNDKMLTIPLPTTTKLSLKTFDQRIDDDLYNFLSIISVNTENNLFSWTNQSNFSLTTILKQVSFLRFTNGYFCGSNSVLKNCIIVIHPHNNQCNYLTIYNTDQQQLSILIHYLYSIIGNCFILPMSYYNSVVQQNENQSEVLIEFKNKMLRELTASEIFLQSSQCGYSNDFVNAERENLSLFENITDKLLLFNK